MQYLGGKFRLGEEIATVLNNLRGDRPYWEPCVGSCWVLRHIAADVRLASDVNRPLIKMWQAIQTGWVPPLDVSEEMYYDVKASWEAQDGRHPEHVVAFVGFACSYSGKWWGGFARSGDRNYAKNAWGSIQKWKLPHIQDVQFFHADMFDVNLWTPVQIYVDPPYAGTTGYDFEPEWDVDRFWNWVRAMSKSGHQVIVSEYRAPQDFDCIWSYRTKTDMHTTSGKEERVEKLFTIAPEKCSCSWTSEHRF